MKNNFFRIFILAILVFCNATWSHENNQKTNPRIQDEKIINTILDDYHRAAAEADGKRYFNYMAEDSRFLGTDAKERWTKKEFQDYATPYFSKGQGWTYTPKDRCLKFSKTGKVAWFDERLFNNKYGELRGSGVLEKQNGIWKITHYNMVFTVPNEIARKVVELIMKQTPKTI